jgi:hypothetical protein
MKTAMPDASADEPKKGSKARDGKIAVVGYFSKDLSRRLNIMKAEEETTIQALVGEALDMLLKARGQKPAGER